MTQSTEASVRSLHPYAELYGYWALDGVAEIAESVLRESVRRSVNQMGMSQSALERVNQYRSDFGKVEDWQHLGERTIAYRRLFAGQACMAMTGVRAAACRFVEHVANGNEPILRYAFVEEVDVFRGTLSSFNEHHLASQLTKSQALWKFAQDMLGDEDILRAAACPSASVAPFDWTDEAYNTTFALTLEGVNRQIPRARTGAVLTSGKVVLLQEVAHYGAATISGVIEGQTSQWSREDEDRLIRNAYRWGNALEGILRGLNVIRAWKDTQYLEGLENIERAILPDNPSGDIDLGGTEFDRFTAVLNAAAQTCTVCCEVCCCGPADTVDQGSCGTCIGFTCPDCSILV